MEGGAWLATVHGVAKSWTRLRIIFLVVSFEAQFFFLILTINCFLKKLLDVWIQSNIFLTHYENFHRVL